MGRASQAGMPGEVRPLNLSSQAELGGNTGAVFWGLKCASGARVLGRWVRRVKDRKFNRASPNASGLIVQVKH